MTENALFDYSSVPLASLLPHGESLCVLRNVLEQAPQKLTVQVDPSALRAGADPTTGRVSSLSMIECIAQAAAIGQRQQTRVVPEIRAGVIVQVRALTFTTPWLPQAPHYVAIVVWDPPAAGAFIVHGEVESRERLEIPGTTLVSATLTLKEL